MGGSGNLGSHIVEQLRLRGAAVTSFDKAAYSGDAAVRSVQGDVCDRTALEEAMKGAEVVFHAASVIDIRPVVSPALERINVGGTQNVIDCCRSCGVRALLYTSSSEVVSGLGADGKPQSFEGADESVPMPEHHVMPYAATKAEAESLVLQANSEELLTCALRPGYIVGPGCIGLKIALTETFGRKGYYVATRLPAQITCINVRNCALAHVLAAERIQQSSVAGQAFFLGDFEANVVEFAQQAFAGSGVKSVMLPLWLAYALALVTDRLYRSIHAACALLGRAYEPPGTAVAIEAVSMAWRNLCFSTERSRKVLGFEPATCNLITREETMQQTNAWAKKFYADLSAGKGEHKVS